MEKRQQAVISGVFAVLVILVFGYFIIGELTLPSDQGKTGGKTTAAVYAGSWERILPSGKRVKIKIPCKVSAARNETVVVETKLPDRIGTNHYLCFRSAKQDMRFFIDGKLRLDYSTKDTRLFGRMSAAAYLFLEVSEEDAGKVLRVESQTDSAYTGVCYTVYTGQQMGVWSYFFKRYGTELVVAFITFILSVIAIIGSLAVRFFYHKRVALEYLGWGILFAAVWLIANSAFRQLLFPNLSVINDIAFLMIMLLALPYLLYMNAIQKERYEIVYHVMEGLVILNFLVCTCLHVTRLCDFTDTIRSVSAFCILSIIVMAATILVDLIKGWIREYLFVAIGMFVVCIAAFIQIVIYFQKVNLFNGVILSIGLIFLLLFCTANTIGEIIEMDREKQQAIQASESKGRFLANMSHEIRTPIHAVLGMDAMILRESTEPQIRAYALDIQNAGQTLLALINDILDISKIESGKLEILPVTYDFSSLINDVVNMMEMKARDKDLEFLLSVDEQIPSRLFGDDVRIRQILVNLLSNAIKYTETGSVSLAVSYEPQGEMADLVFRVTDTGIGIRQEDMEKLFRAFERIEETRNRNIEGTGLGMSITLQLLQMMGTKLEVESVYGQGSVFSFHLLQKIENKEPVGNLEERMKNRVDAEKYQVLFTAPEAHILVVDDNSMNRRVFRNLLKSTCMQVEEAADGEQCLELVKSRNYDLIFLDHMMPGMDGIETLHAMREWEDYPCKNTPVIALTANAITGAREMYLKEGFSDFLSKPVRPEKMEKMIMQMLPPEKVHHGECLPQYTNEQQELPPLEGIDWEYAKLHCRDQKILQETISQFYEVIEKEAAQLANDLQAVCEAVTDEDRAQACRHYRIRVHAMKSSAAMIGAVPLSGMARMLEYAARDEKIGLLQAVTPQFLEDWRALRQILELVVSVSAVSEEEAQAFDAGLMRECLRLLKEAIAEMDIDTADAAASQLKQFAYPSEEMTEAVQQLNQAVCDLDEEQVIYWCDRLDHTK